MPHAPYRAIAAAAVGLAIGGLAAVIWAGWPAGYAPSGSREIAGQANVGGPFSLVDHTGRHVTDRDFRGRQLLVLFGSTQGEGLTQAALQVVAETLRRLEGKADNVAAVLITVHPEIDTPEALGRFLGRIDPRIVGLTGDTDAITKLARAYHVPYRPLPNDPAQHVPDPSRILYVMNVDGSYLFHVAMPTTPEELAARLIAGR